VVHIYEAKEVLKPFRILIGINLVIHVNFTPYVFSHGNYISLKPFFGYMTQTALVSILSMQWMCLSPGELSSLVKLMEEIAFLSGIQFCIRFYQVVTEQLLLKMYLQ